MFFRRDLLGHNLFGGRGSREKHFIDLRNLAREKLGYGKRIFVAAVVRTFLRRHFYYII
jgi:hypothetical protein